MPRAGIGRRGGVRRGRGEDELRATLNAPSAMPFVRKLEGLTQKADATIGRLSHISTRQLSHRALFLTVNLLVAGVVMSLPFIASATSRPSAQASVFSASTRSPC